LARNLLAAGSGADEAMKRLIFSTADLPAELDDEARFKLWHDIYCACMGPFDAARLSHLPFAAQWEFAQFGETVLGRYHGTLRYIIKTPQQIAAASQDRYFLSFNAGATSHTFSQRGREFVAGPGAGVLFAGDDATSHLCDNANAWLGVGVPKQALNELVPNAEDLVATPLDSASPAMPYLRRYLAMLFGTDGLIEDAALLDHVGTTLVDLVALALGASGDAAAVARMRGLRAARLKAILGEIRAGSAEASFSANAVAVKLGLSPRYVHDLLQETGLSFTERVLELRLQKARTMLADQRNDRVRVNDIALRSGFRDPSYFHRCFRRRFGASPAQFRGGGVDASAP
jgi:AraC-like DNA-binding protein